MRKSQLLLACLSLLYLTLSIKGGANAQDNPAHELYEKYGSIAGYIIFHFYYYFNYPTYLEAKLQRMRSSGELASLCRYLPKDVSSCVKSTSSQDTQETMLIVAYLNTDCCNAGQPVNGNWGSWTAWSTCSVTCGGGFQTRTRLCNNPPASNGGSQCLGDKQETRACTGPSCPGRPVNGNWGSWSTWGTCSSTCGGGSRIRTRECNNPPASNGGLTCPGDDMEVGQCNTGSCFQVVNGNWGSWGSWGACSATCGTGAQVRVRNCNNPPPANGGSSCQGINRETRSCSKTLCVTPINGNWGGWGLWSACSASCGGGSRTRIRFCNNPPPSNGGLNCSFPNSNSQTEPCNQFTCAPAPVNGNWGGWGQWSSCSASCGGGSQARIRLCNNPPPSNDGATCSPANSNSETRSCSQITCPPAPVNGNWGGWNQWSSCSASCGGGSQTRIRLCNNPAPSNGGATCSPANSNRETRSCSQITCPPAPVNGNWGGWNQWSSCSASCGGGSQTRIRLCNNPAPSNGGAICSPANSNRETRSCSQITCPPAPVNGNWGVWGLWSSCSASCGSGTRTRIRQCNNPAPSNGGAGCEGSNSLSEPCNDGPCPQARDCGVYKPQSRSAEDVVRGRIIGGHPSNPGQYPWVAMLASNGNVQCGAIIVDNWHVLTAGHCLDDKVLNYQLNSNSFEVIVGQYRRALDPLESTAQRVFVTSGTRHQNYDQRNLLNDVAVLRLAQPLVYNDNVGPICMPTTSDSLPDRCTVAGWGSLSYTGSVPEVLQEVELDVYDNVECQETFQSSTLYDITRYLTKGVMCAANGTSGGQDSCRGDSGSSLMCLQTDSSGALYYKLFGIVSSGFGCGNKGQPGYYTYVPFYTNWIQTTIATLTSAAEAG